MLALHARALEHWGCRVSLAVWPRTVLTCAGAAGLHTGLDSVGAFGAYNINVAYGLVAIPAQAASCVSTALCITALHMRINCHLVNSVSSRAIMNLLHPAAPCLGRLL